MYMLVLVGVKLFSVSQVELDFVGDLLQCCLGQAR
jgi:hypothetical protein